MKAVTAGQMRSVSASQISNWTLCPRRHYFDKVLGMPQDETEPMKRGTAAHKTIEDYFGGLEVSGDEIAEKSIRKLLADPRVPKPRDSLLIEFPRDYRTGLLASGIPVKGRIDMVDVLDANHIPVWDWKTTGKLRNAKSAEELLTNPQYLIYSKYIYERFNPSTVTFIHGNIQTSSPGYSIVETEPSCREEIDEKYILLVESTVEKMKVTTAAEKVDDVPYNTKACWAFGKQCPYASVCPLNASVSFSQLFNRRNEESNTMPAIDVKELLSKRLKSQNGTEADPSAKQPAGSTVPGPFYDASAEPTAEAEPKIVVRAKGINPPDAAKPNPVQKYVPPPAETTSVSFPEAVYAQPARLVLLIDAGVRFLRSPSVLPQPVINLSQEIADRSTEIIAEARKLKIANESTCDIRQIEFGKGTTALAASFRTRPLTGTVVAHTGGLSSIALEVLETQADLIVGR